MTRDAKLYILEHKDWKPLSASFDNNYDYNLKFDITIFRKSPSSMLEHSYAILSLSDKADDIIEEYGAVLTKEKDYLRNTLHTNCGVPLYGDKDNLSFLVKFQ